MGFVTPHIRWPDLNISIYTVDRSLCRSNKLASRTYPDMISNVCIGRFSGSFFTPMYLLRVKPKEVVSLVYVQSESIQ
jgi:hypothetical protein